MKNSGMKTGILGLTIFLMGCGGRPVTGLTEKGLAPCPDRPNCVSSLETGKTHGIQAINYTVDREKALAILKEILSEQENATIISEDNGYLHVEFRTRWLKFVDDMEFWLPEISHVIHMRSASRVGYSDFGVNRKRAERIRMRFEEKTADAR